jgi:glycosyltransferase involved in cell wall biosynthesis
MPRVSIVLPTYNRARFLPDAFRAIREQTWRDWELIVVDDGGSDDTPEVVERLSRELTQQVRFLTQANQGPGAARNTAIEVATGDLLAFYDSDDLWRPQHLADSIAAIDRFPQIEWLLADRQWQRHATGETIRENGFIAGPHRIALDRVSRMLEPNLGLMDGERAFRLFLPIDFPGVLQASVIRRRVFDRTLLPTSRAMEDIAFGLWALAAGVQVAWLADVHVIVRVHTDHASLVAGNEPPDQRLRVSREVIKSYEWLANRPDLSPSQRTLARRQLGYFLFWKLGYLCHWQQGQVEEAFATFRRAIALRPADPTLWKTYLACVIKSGWSSKV